MARLESRLFSTIPATCDRHLLKSHAIFALFLLARLLSAQPDVKTAQEEAMRQIQSGDFSSASKLLRQELQQYPKSAELWNLLGIAETELKQPESAKRAFEQGLSLEPDSVSLNENIGFLFFRNADYATAKKYLRHAVELGSQSPGVRFSLAASQLRTGEADVALEALNSWNPHSETSAIIGRSAGGPNC